MSSSWSSWPPPAPSPPPPYRNPQMYSERAPLLSNATGHESRKTWPSSAWLCVSFLGVLTIVFAVCTLTQSIRLSQYPPTEEGLQALRGRYERVQQAFDADLAAHARLQDYDKWAEDRLTHAHEREWWLLAREQYRVDREQWEQQKTAHKDDISAWQKVLQEHQAAAVRWADEQKRWELERRNFQREREQWASQRSAQEDRYRLDAGNTLGVFWERIESHHCVGHGTREYTAVVGFNADNACQHMPITVNGRMFAVPQECRREGDMVVSRWNVNVGEASCKLYWSDLSDKGCVGWERKRFEAHLLGLDRGMDGMNMCRSTPIDIRGQHFDQPGECQDKDWTISGFWEIYDSACH